MRSPKTKRTIMRMLEAGTITMHEALRLLRDNALWWEQAWLTIALTIVCFIGGYLLVALLAVARYWRG